MASVTHWGRLEPRCRTDDFAEGLRAEVRDPLWMLARQWQMGEFDADDGGSPIVAEVAYAASPIESYRARSGAAVPVDDVSGPLEAMVEREPVPLDLRTRVQAGLQFARFLERRGADRVLPAFVDAFAVSRLSPTDGSDDASERFVAAVAGRVVDGGALLDAALDNVKLWSLTPAGAIATADRDAVDRAADDLVEWFTRTYGAQLGGGAWNPGQLEYEFGVGLAGAPAPEPTLVADDYPGGRLDWYDSDLAVAPPPPSSGAPARDRFLPMPVQFHGMPSSRWWELEDARTDFGAVRPNATDLGLLLLAEFALIYSDDWFITPVPVPVGALVSVTELVVTDTFGERTRIEAAGSRTDDAWQRFGVFDLTRRDGTRASADGLLVPPATAAPLEGRPVESVVLFRDEMANLAWGVEDVLPNALGEPVAGHDIFLRAVRARPEPEPDDEAAALRYQLMTEVAEHWLPFQAVRRSGQGREIALELTPFLREDPSGDLVGIGPKGRILQPGDDPYRVDDEAIPRTPRRVTRSFQRARTADGRTHLWIGRRRSPTRGLGASGLEYDRLEERPPAES